MHHRKKKKKNNRKRIGVALLAVGAVLFIAAVAADALGVGGAAGVGLKQIAGMVAGFVVAMMGYILYTGR